MNIMQLDVVRAVHLEDIACITSEKKARTIQTRLQHVPACFCGSGCSREETAPSCSCMYGGMFRHLSLSA